MLGNSVVVIVRTRPQGIPLAMITMRKSTHRFPFISHDEYWAPLGGRSSAKILRLSKVLNLARLRFCFLWCMVRRGFQMHDKAHLYLQTSTDLCSPFYARSLK